MHCLWEYPIWEGRNSWFFKVLSGTQVAKKETYSLHSQQNQGPEKERNLPYTTKPERNRIGLG